MKPTDLFDLTGKAALVTGGATGIGRMAAEGLMAAGARVLIASRKGDACQAVAAELNAMDYPGQAEGFGGDVSTEEGIAARESSRTDRPPHMSWAAEEGIRERHSIRVDRFPRKPPPEGRQWVFKGIRFVHPWLTLMYGHEAVEGEGAESAAPATTTATAPPATTTPAPDFDSWIEVYEEGESVKQSP